MNNIYLEQCLPRNCSSESAFHKEKSYLQGEPFYEQFLSSVKSAKAKIIFEKTRCVIGPQ